MQRLTTRLRAHIFLFHVMAFNSMLPAAIFDFDGVIVDSEKIHFITFKNTLAELDIDIPEERWYNEFIGTGSKNIIRILFHENKINEDINKWFEKRRAAFFDYVKKNMVETIRGVEMFLVELKASNIKTAVATGSGRTLILFVLDKVELTKYFDVFVTADDVVNKKPHPDIFLKAVALLGADPKQCIAFEDSKNGVESAKSAGLKIVGIKSPSLPEKYCDLVIKDFRDFTLDKMLSLF